MTTETNPALTSGNETPLKESEESTEPKSEPQYLSHLFNVSIYRDKPKRGFIYPEGWAKKHGLVPIYPFCGSTNPQDDSSESSPP
jgi:hypothetical protein